MATLLKHLAHDGETWLRYVFGTTSIRISSLDRKAVGIASWERSVRYLRNYIPG